MKSDNQTTGRGIKHPNHRMHRNSLEAYRTYARELAHLKHKERILQFLGTFPEATFSRLKLQEVLKVRESSLCSALNRLKKEGLVRVENKIDTERETGLPVEHYGHKKEEAHLLSLFGAI